MRGSFAVCEDCHRFTLKTSVTECISSGPTPSPGINVHVAVPSGRVTGAPYNTFRKTV